MAGCVACCRSARFELVALAVLLVFIIIFSQTTNVSTTPFIEGDPALSWPYKEDATVPLWLLAFCALLIPLLAIAAVSARTAVRARRGSDPEPALTQPRGAALPVPAGWAVLGLFLAIAMAGLVTDVLKVAVSRPRPNFFAYCDYAGYREAVASGIYTAYLAAITPGRLGDVSKCQSVDDVQDSQSSFPSGHSSLSFAGLAYLTMYLRHQWGMGATRTSTPLAVLSFIPLALAGWIAVTRIRDGFHRDIDVSVGAIIGVLAALGAWLHVRSHNPTATAAAASAAGAREEQELGVVVGGEVGYAREGAQIGGAGAQLLVPV